MNRCYTAGLLTAAFAVTAFAQIDAPARAVRTARHISRPMKLTAPTTGASTATVTLPLWGSTDGGYSYEMVGADPTVSGNSATTTIPTNIIPIVMKFSDGTIFDPTKSTTCASTSASSLTLASPLFNNTNWTVGSTSGGNTQYIDFFQRSNFWTTTNPTGINPDYHLLLSASQANSITVTVPSTSGKTTTTPSCGKLGMVDINWFDPYLQSTIFPALASAGIGPSSLPVLLLNNVVLYQTTTSNCCILGYHSGFYNPSFLNTIQFYAVADFDTSRDFAEGDISALSHELGELVDDPTGNNSTPGWGNIGQVQGCQFNLEVGDPLTGTARAVAMPNGFTYSIQELAFKSWFYHDTPSSGINGLYSSFGTFTSPASGCSPSVTSLTVSPTTLAVGQPATVSITVGPGSGASGTPTGTVNLMLSNSTTPFATYTLSNGTVNTSVSNLPAGSYSVQADYSGDGSFGPSTSSWIAISVGAPIANLSPTSLTFPTTSPNSTSSLPLTLTNTGTSPLALTSFTLTGPFSQTNTCGSSVAPNASCTFTVVFKPTTNGAFTGLLKIADNAPNSPQTVSLSGTGGTPTAPKVTLNPTSVSFGSVNVGASSKATNVSLSNKGTASLTGISISLTGADAGDFLETNNCPATLAVNASCTIAVTFKPLAGGARAAAISVADNANGSPQTVALTGTGVVPAPAVTLSSTSVKFANTKVGSTTNGTNVTMTNSGNAVLSNISISVTGTTAGDFSQTNTCGTSLNAGAKCTITVKFSPKATGSRAGSVSIVDNAANEPQSISLTGTGQ